MKKLDRNKAGLTFGALLGVWHALWAALVATGLAQGLLDFVFYLHFIKPPYTIAEFSAGTAVMLIVVTTAIGYFLGWLFAAIWNRLHRNMDTSY